MTGSPPKSKSLPFDQYLVLEDIRARLEPLTEEHIHHLLPISLAEPDLLRYSPSPFGSEEMLRQNVTMALEAKDRGQRYPFVIFDKITGRFAGSTSFGNFSVLDQRLEIGWTWLGSSFQGTGLNKHCKFLMLSYAFDELRYQRVEFKIDSRNLQSRRGVEKIGAQFEGELRSHTLLPDGFRRNTVYYSILSREWYKLKQTVFADIWNAESGVAVYLFTYGTLLNNSTHPMSVFLREHAEYVNQGYFHGRLFDVGDFPAAVLSSDSADKVYGHVFQLQRANDMLAILDEYEGISGQSPGSGLFRRKLVTVYADDSERRCWVYLYNRGTQGLERITSGDYAAYRSTGSDSG